MSDRPDPNGVLARLHRQQEVEAAEHPGFDDEEHLGLADHQHLDDPAVHRPVIPVTDPPTPALTQPATGHHERHQDRGAVPWGATRAGGMFADLIGPVPTASPTFTQPEELC